MTYNMPMFEKVSHIITTRRLKRSKLSSLTLDTLTKVKVTEAEVEKDLSTMMILMSLQLQQVLESKRVHQSNDDEQQHKSKEQEGSVS